MPERKRGREGAGGASAGPVLIAGGGIGGLALALTLHEIGVPCTVLEAARELRPLGVGINLQPNAVRELEEMGLPPARLAAIGAPIREWVLMDRAGRELHAEPRGPLAGHRWPQVAVHRGALQMLLAETVRARLGAGAIRTEARVTGFEPAGAGVRARLASGEVLEGSLLIGADGIHSAVRAQMHPRQPPIRWGGMLMWRGVTRRPPIRGGAAFVGLGGSRQRMVLYPISAPDGDGMQRINWIVERTVPRSGRERWFERVPPDAPLAHFADWRLGWLDAPALISGAEAVWENPMIDRDPAPFWVAGRVALLGDAAHAMYPTGSNGASQAIVDARVLGAALAEHGVGEAALRAYEARLHGPVSALVLRNRGSGPFGLLEAIERDGPMAPEARAAFMAGYAKAAGLEAERLNAAPRTVPLGARAFSGHAAGS